MLSSSRKSASAVWMTASNSFERWLISITDIPVPLKFNNSAWASRKTSNGKTPGPGLKLWARLISEMDCDSCFMIIIYGSFLTVELILLRFTFSSLYLFVGQIHKNILLESILLAFGVSLTKIFLVVRMTGVLILPSQTGIQPIPRLGSCY